MAGTFRKPAFLHTGALLKEFENGPERTEARYAQQGACHHVLHQQGTHYADHAQQQEHPPGARAEVILRFDNDGVPEWLEIGQAAEIFSHYHDYAGYDEERRGIYLREHLALSEFSDKYD